MRKIEPIYEYDSNGKEIHYKGSDGYERWHEYDSKGKLIYFKNSIGLEVWYEYDTNGNEIHYKTNNGFEQWFWEGKKTKDPVKILLLASKLHSKVSQ